MNQVTYTYVSRLFRRIAVWICVYIPCLLCAQYNLTETVRLHQEAIEAIEDNDPYEAISLIDQALRNTIGSEQYEQISKSHMIAAKAYQKAGQQASSLRSYFQAIYALERMGDDSTVADINSEIGLLYENMGIPEKAVEYYQIAYKIRDAQSDTTGKLSSLKQMARSYMAMDSLDEALIYYSQLFDFYETQQNRLEMIDKLHKLVEIFKRKNQYFKALGHNEQILDLANELGDSTIIATAIKNLGQNFSYIEDYERAITLFRQTLQIDLNMGADLRHIITDYINLGISYRNLGNTEEALLQLLKGLKLLKKRDKLPGEASTLCNTIAEIYQKEGDYQSANRYIKEAITYAQQGSEAKRLMQGYRIYSSILQDQDKYEDALNYYQAYLRIRDSLELQASLLQQEVSQQQISMEKLEKDLKLLLAEEEMRDLQLRQLQLEGEKQEQENQLLRRERELQELALAQEATEKDRALKALQLARERIEAQKRDQEIERLQQNERLQAMNLQQKELEAQQQQQEYEMLQSKNEQQEILLRSEKAKQRYLLIILGLAVAVIILSAIGFFQNRKNNRRLARQKEAVQNSRDELELTLNDLRKTHNQLQQAQTQLVEAEKMASLGQLTAGIAHEINNPINFVSSNISPLKQDFSELHVLIEKVKMLFTQQDRDLRIAEIQQYMEQIDAPYLFHEIQELLDGIEEGAVRTKEIVVGLRNFSRLDEGEFKQADIHQGLDSTLTLLNSRMKRRITVYKDYGNLPLVQCLPGKLNQVFMNILINAIQAIEDRGGIYIKTWVANGNSSNGQSEKIMISIRDTGIGMDEHTRKRVFDPFFTTKEVGQGTGLGLSISYGIIEQHKGQIEVQSQPGKGTSFCIVLPVEQK